MELKKPRRFTESDKEFIKLNLGILTHQEMADALGFSMYSIRDWVCRKGLSTKRLPASKPGDKFGLLTLLNPAPSIYSGNQITYRWYCMCDCGNDEILIKWHKHLRRGAVVSCGCWKKLPYHERFLKE